MNLNYEEQWVESSKVFNLYGRKNYVGSEFYRRVTELSSENIKKCQKDFF